MRRLLILLAVFAMLVTACGGNDGDAETTTTAAAQQGGDGTATTAGSTETTSAPATTAAPPTTGASGGVTALTDSALQAALAQSEQATSGRFEGSFMIVGGEGMPAGSEFSISFSGEYDDQGNSVFIMDMSDAAGAAPGGEEIPAEFADLFGEMEVRTVGDTSYLRFGMFAMLGVNTQWVSLPADEAGDAAASFGANPVNPSDIMSSFGPGVSDVQEIGRETIRGVETTHFQVIVDIEAMMEAADEEALEELEGIGTTFPSGTMPVDYWIGDDGNIYRFTLVFDGTLDTEQPFEQMTMVWEMYDYNSNDIVIEEPPADDVTDGAGLGAFLSG